MNRIYEILEKQDHVISVNRELILSQQSFANAWEYSTTGESHDFSIPIVRYTQLLSTLKDRVGLKQKKNQKWVHSIEASNGSVLNVDLKTGKHYLSKSDSNGQSSLGTPVEIHDVCNSLPHIALAIFEGVTGKTPRELNNHLAKYDKIVGIITEEEKKRGISR